MDVGRVGVAWCGVCLCFRSNGMMSEYMILSECRENKRVEQEKNKKKLIYWML